jgi:hypothetical protein
MSWRERLAGALFGDVIDERVQAAVKVVETGRFKMFRDDGSSDWSEFWSQVDETRYEVSEGEERRMKWGVMDAALHDDRVIAAALVAELDKVPWSVPGKSAVIEARDVLEEMDEGRF